MFVVAIEKVDDGGHGEPDPVIIIRSNWLTPRKQECYWPPYKKCSKFNAALSKAEEPEDNWKLISIKKRLYETDDLQIARQKAREAEFESDLITYIEESSKDGIRRSKRRKKLNLHSSTESEYSEEEVDSGSNFEHISRIPIPPSSSLFAGVQIQDEPSSQHSSSISPTQQVHRSQSIYTTTPSHSVESGGSTLQARGVQVHDGPLSQHTSSKSSIQQDRQSQPIFTSTPSHSVENGSTLQTRGFEVLLRKIEKLTEITDENNKVLHLLLAEKNKPAEDLSINEYPFSLPCESLQDVEAVEEFLKDPENKKNFVSNLGAIGGVNADKHVRRMLCYLFTNDLAQQYNWIGKGNKRSLKDTIIPKVIIDAVKRNKRNFSGTTVCEIEGTIKQWFRFAKDRSGGREKRRSQNQAHIPK